MTYNIILGKPILHEINSMISTKYLTIKFPINKGVIIMRRN